MALFILNNLFSSVFQLKCTGITQMVVEKKAAYRMRAEWGHAIDVLALCTVLKEKEPQLKPDYDNDDRDIQLIVRPEGGIGSFFCYISAKEARLNGPIDCVPYMRKTWWPQFYEAYLAPSEPAEK